MEPANCCLTDSAVLAALLCSLPDGGEVELLVSGESMAPFYRHRETVVTLRREPVCPSQNGRRVSPQMGDLRFPRRGDAVFFLRTDGTPVLHRVVRVSGTTLTVGGDGQRRVESIDPAQILGRVVRVRRRVSSRPLSTDARGYRLLVGLWSFGRWWHPRVAKWYRRICRERRKHTCRSF